MYTFNIKDNTPDINIIVTRCLLVLASIGAIVYRSNQPFIINIIVSVVLLSIGIAAGAIIKKLKINEEIVLITGCLLLLIATHSPVLSLVLICIKLIVKKLYRKPVIHINSTGIVINKMLANTTHPWNEFNNIILKDTLLTLDFKDNKLWQLSILEEEKLIDEYDFNNFCSKEIGV